MLDTHKSFKGLLAAGFDEKQAETIIAAIQDIDYSVVATKGDIADLKEELKVEMDKRFSNVDKRFIEVNERFTDISEKIMKSQADNLKFSILQTVAIMGLMIALFQIIPS